MDIRFDSVRGQDAALSALSRNVRLNRVSSAYLFAGPSGTGKAETGLIFAKSLLCDSTGEKPCGRCRSCGMFEAGTHPDFYSLSPDGDEIKINYSGVEKVIEKANGKDIKIEQMRCFISALSLKSYRGGKKAAVVNEADKMNRQAQNAFLKTLEEPSGDSVLILISSNPAAILPTIVSRCRKIRFVPMKPEVLAEFLQKDLSIGSGEALSLAMLAEGCPGKALGSEIEKIMRVDEEASELMGRLLETPPEEVIAFAKGWRKRRNDLSPFIDRLINTLRLAVCANYGLSFGKMASEMNNLNDVPSERLLSGYEALLETKSSLVFNPNVQLFMEGMIFNLQSILESGAPLAERSN